MSYSCTDFVDTILDALNVIVPEELYDAPSEQADLALTEINRLQQIERAFNALLIWEKTMGGFEAKAWDKAKKLANK
jgi:hypothetical protein